MAEEVRDAAVWLEEQGADAIDINMGCPFEKVIKIGAGAAMLKDPQKNWRVRPNGDEGGQNSGDGKDAPGLGPDAA